jgi:hypothetical protein
MDARTRPAQRSACAAGKRAFSDVLSVGPRAASPGKMAFSDVVAIGIALLPFLPACAMCALLCIMHAITSIATLRSQAR